MKSTGRGGWRESFWRDEHLCPCNFLVEHIVSYRRQWFLLISIEQCYHCLRTIGFRNILRLLWSRDCFWTVFLLMIRWNPGFFPIPNTLDTESHPVKGCRNNRSLQSVRHWSTSRWPRNARCIAFPIILCTTAFSLYTVPMISLSPMSSIKVPVAPNTFMKVWKVPSNSITSLIGLSSITAFTISDAF